MANSRFGWYSNQENDRSMQYEDNIFVDNAHHRSKHVFRAISHSDITSSLLSFLSSRCLCRIQFNQEESWTKALKYMLTNMKWCLAWVCKQGG